MMDKNLIRQRPRLFKVLKPPLETMQYSSSPMRRTTQSASPTMSALSSIKGTEPYRRQTTGTRERSESAARRGKGADIAAGCDAQCPYLVKPHLGDYTLAFCHAVNFCCESRPNSRSAVICTSSLLPRPQACRLTKAGSEFGRESKRAAVGYDFRVSPGVAAKKVVHNIFLSILLQQLYHMLYQDSTIVVKFFAIFSD